MVAEREAGWQRGNILTTMVACYFLSCDTCHFSVFDLILTLHDLLLLCPPFLKTPFVYDNRNQKCFLDKSSLYQRIATHNQL